MSNEAWHERYVHLRRMCKETGEARVDSTAHSVALHDWLEHQKALAALGLPPKADHVYPLYSCQLHIPTAGYQA